MDGFIKLLIVQTKVALRNKQIVLCYYVIPLLFFLIFGSVLVKMNANARDGLPVSMVMFSVSMGTFLGLSVSLNELMKEEYYKAFRVMNVSIYKIILAEQISCGIHMVIQGLIIMVCSSLIFGSKLAMMDNETMVALMLYLIFNIEGSTVIGLMARNRNVLMVLGQLCFFITIFLGGIMFPISYLPNVLQKIANVLPTAAVVNIRDKIGDGNLSQLLVSVAVILAIYIVVYQVKLNSKVA